VRDKGGLRNLTVAAVLIAALLPAGCGGKYDKPLETPGGTIPIQGSYTHIGRYEGFKDATDFSLSYGLLFVAFEDPGMISVYFNTGKLNTGITFEGPGRPRVIGAGGKRIAVADYTTMRVKVYGWTGGDTLFSFGDPDWVEISAIALDDSANIYVADRARNLVRAYGPEGQPRFQIDLADSGYGIGHVLSPKGLYFDGEALLIAEAEGGKNQVQRIRVDEPQQGILFSETVPFLGSFTDSLDNTFPFVRPVDAAADNDGNVFVLDQGQPVPRIFKFDKDGRSVAFVNTLTEGAADTLVTPVCVETYLDDVYALDAAVGVIHRWELEWIEQPSY
jgi:hypothetical protein